MIPERVCALDLSDPLVGKKAAFLLPENTIYLDGNSLGPLPKAAKAQAEQTISQQWGEDLITSWNKHGWIDLPQQAGEKIAKIVGAAPGQVICCDSTSVNLFKVLAAALTLQPGRSKVLSDKDNFPTDLYMVEGLRQCGLECALDLQPAGEIINALDESVAVLLLTEVNFRTGQRYNMASVTAAAHAKGILVVWDLAHSAGAFPVELDACQVDFAVGCGYKYLNGGPGAPAFLYVAHKHQQAVNQPLSGWMGHAAAFAFSPQYQPAPGVQQFLCGTPPVLSMSVLNAALDIFADVDMNQIRVKSEQLMALFLQTLEAKSTQLVLVSPSNVEQRGSQLAFGHPQAYAICQALIARGVIADFRAPDILRLGFAPLYLSYQDVWQAAETLAEVVSSENYLQPQFQVKQKVT